MKTIETPDCTYRLDDSLIVHLGFPQGYIITRENAERCVAIGNEHFPHQPRLLLMNLEGVKSISREARMYLVSQPGPTAVALIGLSPVARMIAAMFIGLRHQAHCQVRVFRSQETAAAWLQEFLPVAVAAGASSEEMDR